MRVAYAMDTPSPPNNSSGCGTCPQCTEENARALHPRHRRMHLRHRHMHRRDRRGHLPHRAPPPPVVPAAWRAFQRAFPHAREGARSQSATRLRQYRGGTRGHRQRSEADGRVRAGRARSQSPRRPATAPTGQARRLPPGGIAQMETWQMETAASARNHSERMPSLPHATAASACKHSDQKPHGLQAQAASAGVLSSTSEEHAITLLQQQSSQHSGLDPPRSHSHPVSVTRL